MVSITVVDTAGPVVMVDDSADDIEIARRCYEDSRMSNPFIGMQSGKELLEYLDEVHEGTAVMPAIVLLDINMPGMSGFDVLVAVRKNRDLREIPIIMMLTNSDWPEDFEKARTLGANDYQTKPFELASYVAFFDGLCA